MNRDSGGTASGDAAAGRPGLGDGSVDASARAPTDLAAAAATAAGAGLEELIDTLRRRTADGDLSWARWAGRGTFVASVGGDGVVLAGGADGLSEGEDGPEGAARWTQLVLLSGDGREAGRFSAGPGRAPQPGDELPAETAEGLRRLYDFVNRPAAPAGDRVVDRMLRGLGS